MVDKRVCAALAVNLSCLLVEKEGYGQTFQLDLTVNCATYETISSLFLGLYNACYSRLTDAYSKHNEMQALFENFTFVYTSFKAAVLQLSLEIRFKNW